MSAADTPLLRRVTKTIVDVCGPDQILLFGSWAKGNVHLASDLDIVVVVPSAGSRWSRGQELRDALRHLPLDIDLHVFTREEFLLESARPLSYINTLQATCLCLYNREPNALSNMAAHPLVE